LKEKGKILEEADARNSIPPPSEMLTKTPVPDPANIHFRKIDSFEVDSAPKQFDLSSMPVYTHLHSTDTNFVYVSTLFLTFKPASVVQ